MTSDMHDNLFQYGDKADVYAALQRDCDRDAWRHLGWHAIFLGAAVGASQFADHPDWLWLFLGMFALKCALARFIDNSNRNWTMHLIDWLENERYTRK